MSYDHFFGRLEASNPPHVFSRRRSAAYWGISFFSSRLLWLHCISDLKFTWISHNYDLDFYHHWRPLRPFILLLVHLPHLLGDLVSLQVHHQVGLHTHTHAHTQTHTHTYTTVLPLNRNLALINWKNKEDFKNPHTLKIWAVFYCISWKGIQNQVS